MRFPVIADAAGRHGPRILARESGYAKLPAGINPANVKFIAEHQAELDAMQKEFEALGKPRRN